MKKLFSILLSVLALIVLVAVSGNSYGNTRKVSYHAGQVELDGYTPSADLFVKKLWPPGYSRFGKLNDSAYNNFLRNSKTVIGRHKPSIISIKVYTGTPAYWNSHGDIRLNINLPL